MVKLFLDSTITVPVLFPPRFSHIVPETRNSVVSPSEYLNSFSTDLEFSSKNY